MVIFTPRLDAQGIENNPYWYSDNIYYQSGFGMPNCTAYALGRWYELQGSAESFGFPFYGDGQDWYTMGVESGYQYSKTTPLLGAAISWSYVGGGHVAIVEQINYNLDGTINNIITSNSAYQGTYFYTQTLYASDGYMWRGNSTLNGFIYHPNYTPKKKHLPVWMMIKQF